MSRLGRVKGVNDKFANWVDLRVTNLSYPFPPQAGTPDREEVSTGVEVHRVLNRPPMWEDRHQQRPEGIKNEK